MTHVVSIPTLLSLSALLMGACSHSSPQAARESARESSQARVEERNEVAEEQRQERMDDRQNIAAAEQNQPEQERAFADEARHELASLDARADHLQASANSATGDKQREAHATLATVPDDVQVINDCINALANAPADRITPAKAEITDRLSLLDGKLRRVESLLRS